MPVAHGRVLLTLSEFEEVYCVMANSDEGLYCS